MKEPVSDIYKNVMKKILTSNLFDNSVITQTFYFILSFFISLVLWIPVGSLIIAGMAFINLFLELLSVQINITSETSVIIRYPLAIAIYLMILLPVFFINFINLKVINNVSLQRTQTKLLALISGIATLLSFYYFINVILQNSWWVN